MSSARLGTASPGGLTELLGARSGGGLLVPLGAVALVVVGVHAGADFFDDQLFALLNLLDGWIDRAFAFVVTTVWGWFGADTSSAESIAAAFAGWVDIEEKVAGAKYGALGLELLADLMLAFPLLGPGLGGARARELVRAVVMAVKDPTVLRLVLPFAVTCAGLAGVAAVSRELEASVHGVLVGRSESAAFAARFAGVASAAVVGWYLAVPAVLRAAVRADRIAVKDYEAAQPWWERRFRGTWLAAVTLPVAFAAVQEAEPLLRMLMALAGAGS